MPDIHQQRESNPDAMPSATDATTGATERPSPTTAPAAPPETAAPVDQRLEQLQELTAELHELDGATTDEATKAGWPTGFCLSILVPVYNEVRTVQRVLEKLLSLEIPKQIIVIDDGSRDGTREVLAQWIGYDEIEVVLKGRNEGKGAALRTGFAHVDGDLVVVQDADLEYDPTELLDLVRPILEGRADVVYGSRFLEQRWQGSSALHRWGNRLLTSLSNFTTGLQLTDMETCYKVFPAALLNELEVRQDRFGFEPEITAKLARRDMQFLELPIGYHARNWDEGKKIGIRDAISAVYCIARYAWLD